MSFSSHDINTAVYIGDYDNLAWVSNGIRWAAGERIAFRVPVAAGIESGQDLEAILASGATAEFDAKWGKVFFRPRQFTEIVFLSLSGKKTAASQGARKK